jgi:hypothetical protein
LLGPVETLLKNNKRSLLVAPSGALTALPFHLLVTDQAGRRDSRNIRGLSRCCLSVASLKALGFLRATTKTPNR